MFGSQPPISYRKQWRNRFVAVFVCLSGLLALPALASDLDREIERLNADVLKHAAKVFELEQALLHPADTRMAVFMTLDSGQALALDSIELYLNSIPVASHLYSDHEQAALEAGGVQQVYTGNLPDGTHELKAVITARSANDDFVRRESVHRFRKRPGTLRLQLGLSADAPDYEPDVTMVEWK